MTEAKFCRNCAHFAKPEEYLVNLTRGECRRYAPRPWLNRTSDIDARPLWPYVLSGDGCGEFRSSAFNRDGGEVSDFRRDMCALLGQLVQAVDSVDDALREA